MGKGYVCDKISFFQKTMELIFLLCASLFFLLMLLLLSKSQKANLNLPPGPKQLPIIGNMHQLASRLIHHTLRDLADVHGPLMHLQLGQVSTIVVSSPEMAKEIFRTHDLNFVQRPTNNLVLELFSYGFSDMAFSPYGSYWKELRKVAASELLNQKRVQSFRYIREDVVNNLVRDVYLHKGSVVNLSKKIFSMTNTIAGRITFGEITKEHHMKFVDVISKVNGLAVGFFIGDMFPSLNFLTRITGLRKKAVKLHKEIDQVLGTILEEHKHQVKSGDRSEEIKEYFVDVLLRVQASMDSALSLTDDNIKGALFDMISGGSDTSSTIVEWAMAELMKNPETMQRAQDEVRNLYNEEGNVNESRLDELEYLQAIVKETLRLHPSFPLLIPRESKEECIIHGYHIPAKARIMVNFWAMGRDPKYWAEPKVFYPDRFLQSNIDYSGNTFEYIPFSSGRRICPGIEFAKPNMLLPLAQLLFHFDWKLAGGVKPEELNMDEKIAITVTRKHDLELVASPYCRSNITI